MKAINEALVLIVDDTEENVEILVEALGDDYDVAVAMDGEAALEAVDSELPDIILLDVMMPNIDGYEVCKILKSSERTAAIPIIFLTALSNIDAKTKGFECGAVDFVTKPFEITEVRARVHTHLSIYFMGIELEEQRQIAEENARVKAEFLATMSHEIRTPMNGIIGMTQLLMETPLNDKQKGFSQTIYDSSTALLAIINDILDHSKLDAGKFELENIPFSPLKLVESVKSLMVNRAEAKGLQLNVLCEKGVPSVVAGDPNRIRQVLLNFIGNAIKFTEKGSVTLNLKSDIDGKLFFSVIDTGIGIGEEGRKKLFKDFSQVDSSISRRYGGTGLGLSISSRIVNMMKGTIGVKSEPEVGSEFWFAIPIEVTDQPEVELFNRQDNVLFKLPKIKILIVEDNRVNQQVLKGMLEGSKHEISIANNGLESVKACIEHTYDVVLMDMQMPDMDGIQATRKIRELPDMMSNVPIIAVTASAMDSSKENCFVAGMNGYITKPINQNDLMSEIARVVNLKLIKEKRNISTKKDLKYFEATHLSSLEEAIGKDYLVFALKEFVNSIACFEKRINDAIASLDKHRLVFEVHKIKGASANLGMTILSEIASNIEKKIDSEQWDEIKGLITELNSVLDKSLCEAEVMYPEAFEDIKLECDEDNVDAYVVVELEKYLYKMLEALEENSIDKYENAANFTFSIDLPKEWDKCIRQIDMLAFGDQYCEAKILIKDMLKKLKKIEPKDSPRGFKAKLLNLHSALLASKPKDITFAMDNIRRLSLPIEIEEKVSDAMEKVEMYRYKEAVEILEECFDII